VKRETSNPRKAKRGGDGSNQTLGQQRGESNERGRVGWDKKEQDSEVKGRGSQKRTGSEKKGPRPHPILKEESRKGNSLES